MYSQNPLTFENQPKGSKRWYRRWWGIIIIIFLTIFLIIFTASAIYVVKVVYLLRAGQITSQQLFGGESSPDQLTGLLNLATQDDPAVGPKDAKVVIVEFSDFQCPACGQAYPVVKQILRDYADRIRFVYRDFPDTQSHPQSLIAAVAAQCAYEQGRFWEMHDKIFEDQQNLSEENLKKYAIQIGLNNIKFELCLQAGKSLKEVEQDWQQGFVAGVKATPTFFINGVKVAGAIPLDTFQKIIVAELNK